jgi:hypothetical protein
MHAHKLFVELAELNLCWPVWLAHVVVVASAEPAKWLDSQLSSVLCLGGVYFAKYSIA